MTYSSEVISLSYLLFSCHLISTFSTGLLVEFPVCPQKLQILCTKEPVVVLELTDDSTNDLISIWPLFYFSCDHKQVMVMRWALCQTFPNVRAASTTGQYMFQRATKRHIQCRAFHLNHLLSLSVEIICTYVQICYCICIYHMWRRSKHVIIVPHSFDWWRWRLSDKTRPLRFGWMTWMTCIPGDLTKYVFQKNQRRRI